MFRRTQISALVIGFALAAAACGGSSGKANDGNLIDKDVKNEIANQQASTSTTGVNSAKEPTTIAEWETLWASQRAAIVKKIKDNKWGVQTDGKTVLGPDGFTMDLSKCPAGWNAKEGLTDTEIKLGSSAPASGPQATAININKAMSVIMDYYAGQDLFKDSLGKNRKVNQIIKDDAYDPAKTIPLVDELIDSEFGGLLHQPAKAIAFRGSNGQTDRGEWGDQQFSQLDDANLDTIFFDESDFGNSRLAPPVKELDAVSRLFSENPRCVVRFCLIERKRRS